MPRLGPGGGGGGGQRGEAGVPADDYISVLKGFKRAQGKTSGKDYLRMRWQVIAGPQKGKTYFCNMSCDLSKDGTVARWQSLIEGCGVDEEFELGSRREGTHEEGDENIKRLFLNVPIKMRVRAERNGEYVNNDIEFFHYRSKWTQADKDLMNAWIDDFERRQAGGGGGSEGGEYDDPPTTGGAGDYSAGGFGTDDDYVPPGGGTRAGGSVPDDDDIPF